MGRSRKQHSGHTGKGKGRRRAYAPHSVGVVHVARRGYAFVETPEGPYFILPRCLNGAMDGDLVEVVRLRRLEERRRVQAGSSPESDQATRRAWRGDGAGTHDMLGSVFRVVERAHATVVGTLHETDGLRVVRPLDKSLDRDLFVVSDGRSVDCRAGDLVEARITVYPTSRQPACGFIEAVLGHEGDQGLELEAIIRRHKLETEFSRASLEQSELLAAQGAVAGVGNEPLATVLAASLEAKLEAALERRDLRDLTAFTIDPVDARDHDDALSAEYVDGMLHLGVHIADVSAFVPWESAIDLDARRRGTSVYLPGRVIPMLPAALSEELCSLRPGAERLAMTVEMTLRPDGVVEHVAVYPSVIRSRARLVYDEVLEVLEGTAGGIAGGPDGPDGPGGPDGPDGPGGNLSAGLKSKLVVLDRLAQTLAARRLKRGAIDFDKAETKLEIDAEGRVCGVRLRTKNRATSLVEEAMILANESVATLMLSAGSPFVYRVHDEPLPATLEELLPTLQEFGYATSGAPLSSFEVQQLVSASRGRPEHDLVATLLLRAMRRAVYLPRFTTHYGLASDAYAHFTSPIRRYPDIMAHRLLKLHLLAGQEGYGSVSRLLDARPRLEKATAGMLQQLEWICEHSSDTEREAEAATSEAVKAKLCEFFADRVGERFGGCVSGVNSHGLFVREDETHAEGFVPADKLPGDFAYEATRQRWADQATQRCVRLGQQVRVVLESVDVTRHELRFGLQ
ncbi:MAG: RNB domain-containing ribonuclease [Coriobacteriales bacterium]|jgi:ribonuclease R|nr:RNB domain-containing ribonuclease [Coriobacteriales bacterium]